MHQLNSCQMGKFEKITIQGDVKFLSFDMALENWQTAQMPPRKSPKIISMIEHFSVQITWKILLKIIKNPGKLKFTNLLVPHGILFCQERPGILEGTHKSNFFHTKHPLEAFPDPSFPLSKVSTQQNRFFKKKPNKILSLLIFSIGRK